jgi:tetratricopeptide (TPR) repeat protein
LNGLIPADLVGIHHNYIILLLEMGCLEDSVTYCEEILQQTRDPIILLDKSDALFCQGKLKDSLNCIDEVIDILEKSGEQKSLLSTAYNNMGIILTCMNQSENALKIFECVGTSESVYNQTLLLLESFRNGEACILWLKQRKIPLDLPLLDYQKLLSKLVEQERGLRHSQNKITMNVITTHQLLLLDIRVLEIRMTMREEPALVIAEGIIEILE